MEYVGIDLGLEKCKAGIIDYMGNIKKRLEFSNEEEGWNNLTENIEPEAIIAFEASTLAYPLYDFLTARGYKVKVAHPKRIKEIVTSNSKTDDKDSLVIANLLRLNYLPLSYIPTKETLKNREVLRARIMIGRELVRVKNRIHAFVTKNGLKPLFKENTDTFGMAGMKKLKSLRFNDYRDSILKAMLVQIENLEKQKELLQTEIAKLSSDNEDAKILMSIRGIDYYSALLIVSELGDVNRFKDEKAVCSYPGLVPKVRQSSFTTRIGSITKEGPSTLRWILSVVTDVAIRYNPQLKEFYKRILRRKKSRKLAKTATARKLLVSIYYMLKRKERYEWENETSTERKLARLQRLCRRKALVS
ncbi:MAG: IS110 family transposase [Candidatus Thermoplasmatota archaeon]|nr:IS110 family transposase [Candidatus Thermoplasmatota archaeon]